MNTKTTSLAATLAALSAWCALPSLSAANQGQPAESSAKLASLIDPPPAGLVQQSTPPQHELIDLVNRLINEGQGEQISIFGESVGPALRDIVSVTELDALTRDDEFNPLSYLVEHAPLEALDFFVELQATQTFRYEALVRGEWGPRMLTQGPATRGESLDLFLGLMDRTLASETLDLESKVRLAAAALKDDQRTARSEGLIRQNPGLAVGFAKHDVTELLVPPGSSPPSDLDARVAHRLLEQRPSIEVFEGLLDSADSSVRTQIAYSIEDAWSSGSLPANRTFDVLASLVRDPSAQVSKAALDNLDQLLRSDSLWLNSDTLTRLFEAVASKSEVAASTCIWLVTHLNRTVALEVDTNPAGLGQLYGTVFRIPNPRLREVLQEVDYPAFSPGQALAFYEAVAPTSNEARDLSLWILERTTRKWEALSPERTEALFLILSSDVVTPEDAEWFVKEVTHDQGGMDRVANGIPGRRIALNNLPPRYAARAAKFVVASGGRYDDLFFAGCVHWADAGPELRALLSETSAAPRERLFAGGTLALSGAATDRDIDAFRDLVLSLVDQPSGEGDLDWYFTNLATHSPGESSVRWNRASAALLEAASFPDALANEQSFVGGVDTNEGRELARRILTAAEQRAVSNTGLRFPRLAYSGLKAMGADPSLFQPRLLRTWLEDSRGFFSEAVTVVLATEDPGWARSAADLLLGHLRTATTGYRQISLADQILRLPGEEPVQRLLDEVMRSGNPDLVSHVEQRVAELLRIREASLRWSNLASGGTDLDGAKAQVLALLDSPTESVRIEAIRGLGTLGAVEALPVLIELVGSDSEAERAAAKETLDLLRRRAALQLDRAETGSVAE